ncbi:preprotein translocase subunit SecG [Candidatus Dependentiae bacterium]
MLYGLLVTLFVSVCFLLILIILIQQGKGGLGLGAMGGGAQMLFGGSGGQDIFQKITWVLGAIFMFGSLLLFLLGSKGVNYSRYLGKKKALNKVIPQPAMPKATKNPFNKEIPKAKGLDVKKDVAKDKSKK